MEAQNLISNRKHNCFRDNLQEQVNGEFSPYEEDGVVEIEES